MRLEGGAPPPSPRGKMSVVKEREIHPVGAVFSGCIVFIVKASAINKLPCSQCPHLCVKEVGGEKAFLCKKWRFIVSRREEDVEQLTCVVLKDEG